MACPSSIWALAALFAHVLLDGIDGPLARHLGRASDRGSFTDSTADQTVVVATTLTLIHAGHAAVWPGGLYLALYTVVVLFAMARNALAVPYSWLVRPRFVVFAWVPIEILWWPGRLDYLLWVAAGLLGRKAVTGFVRIRRKI